MHLCVYTTGAVLEEVHAFLTTTGGIVCNPSNIRSCGDIFDDVLAVMQMKLKQERKLNQEAAQQARQAYKAAVKAKHEQMEAAKQKKIENRRKEDVKQGVQLSAAAARKMMKDKKQRKQIVTA